MDSIAVNMADFPAMFGDVTTNQPCLVITCGDKQWLLVENQWNQQFLLGDSP
jgi:hypothetical protein